MRFMAAPKPAAARARAGARTTRLSRDAGRALLQLLEPPACLERCAEGLRAFSVDTARLGFPPKTGSGGDAATATLSPRHAPPRERAVARAPRSAALTVCFYRLR